MSHLALDLALGTTGICWGSDPEDVDTLTAPTLTGGARLEWWWQALRSHIVSVDAVVVEAPFIHYAHPSGSIPGIKLHGLLEWLCCHEGVRYQTVAPTALKKWATGNGRADKPLMVACAQERGYRGDDHNEADAYLIWHWWNAQR